MFAVTNNQVADAHHLRNRRAKPSNAIVTRCFLLVFADLMESWQGNVKPARTAKLTGRIAD
jgi:hypothetical protein